MPKPCETTARKNAETLLLEPTKNKEKKLPQAARKMPKRCFWNLLKTKKKSCLKQGKPLRNIRFESPQATRQNPWKTCLGRACEKAEPQQVLCPSHCETAAWKIPKRCFWNPLKKPLEPIKNNALVTVAGSLQETCLWRSGSDRFTQRKKAHGGAPSSCPPPFDHNLLQQLPRRAPPRSDEGSADNDEGWGRIGIRMKEDNKDKGNEENENKKNKK